MRRHRSRRQKRQGLNVIGFSQSLHEIHDSSEDESDFEVAEGDASVEHSFSVAVSPLDEGVFDGRLDKMSSDLDGLVRFIRREVESFAGGIGDAAPTFGILAFALEDWDN
jgi:gamma-tubulin complex component 5